jgi:hypothetical protein
MANLNISTLRVARELNYSAPPHPLTMNGIRRKRMIPRRIGAKYQMNHLHGLKGLNPRIVPSRAHAKGCV